MPTVNFPCTHCGKLMGVGNELLGKQVRCPHCKQVLHAPASATPVAAPPAPAYGENTFQFPRAREEDSIFGVPEPSDDLFNESPRMPVVEIPSGVTWPKLQLEGRAAPPPEPPAPPEMPTLAYEPPVEDAPPPAPENPPEEEPFPARGDDWAESAGVGQDSELEPEVAHSSATLARASSARRAERREDRGGVLPIIILIFLVPYSIFATGAAIYFYYIKQQKAPHPLEGLPDFQGDNPGASRKRASTMTYERWPPDMALPARLRVPLGGTLRIGDLEVKPEKVQRRRVVYCYENAALRAPTESPDDALVLTMRLRNVSEDVHFAPTDLHFVKKWQSGDPWTDRPYSLLEVGKKKYYGGACKWVPRGAGNPGWRGADLREYIEGQENAGKILKPGEEMTTVVTTDPENAEVLAAVDAQKGPLVWRVQLRRGLVKVGNKEVPASAVVGVEIKPGDVQ